MPGGSRPGSAPGLNRSRDLLAASPSPNSAWAIFPSAAGSVKHAPGLAAKPLLDENCRAGAGNSALIAAHVDLVAKVMGMSDVAGAVSNTDGMLLVFFVTWTGRTTRLRKVFARPQSLRTRRDALPLHGATGSC